MNLNLEISREERVLRLTLNRPEKRNALSVELCTAIADAVVEAASDKSVGAVLIDAKGKVFCAGMDLDEALEPGASERTVVHERLFTIGATSVKPIIAAVQGPALGGGVGLLANAHIVVAAHGSSFGLTEIRIGMWPFIIFRAVAAALGERRAIELSLTGRIFNLPEASQWGLVHESVPAFELDDRAMAIANHVAGFSPHAVRSGLEFVQGTRGLDRVAAGELALRFRAETFESADFREGVQAFKEKRPPIWPAPQ